MYRVVTKISSCRVNTTSRRGIKQLRVSFGSFFFYFPLKVARGHIHSSRGKSPAPASSWQLWYNMYIIWGGSSVQLLVPDQFLPTGKSFSYMYMYSLNKHIFEIFKKKKTRTQTKKEESKIINHHFSWALKNSSEGYQKSLLRILLVPWEKSCHA